VPSALLAAFHFFIASGPIGLDRASNNGEHESGLTRSRRVGQMA
jgi:hypothetical protein